MSKRIKLPDVKKAENQDLQTILENYIRKSEELEIKENTLIKQMEVMQSAVTSLKQWNEHRRASTEEPVSLDPIAIEEETRLIREETARIQEEIEKKIEENKVLREEVAYRKRMHDEKYLDSTETNEKMGEVECRSCSDTEIEPSIEFFQRKLQKLKEMQKALKEESRDKIEENRKKTKELSKKIERLEWEFDIDRTLAESFRNERKF